MIEIPDDLAGEPIPAVPMSAVVSRLRYLAGLIREGLTPEQAAVVLDTAAKHLERELREALLDPAGRTAVHDPDQTPNDPPKEN